MTKQERGLWEDRRKQRQRIKIKRFFRFLFIGEVTSLKNEYKLRQKRIDKETIDLRTKTVNRKKLRSKKKKKKGRKKKEKKMLIFFFQQ